MVTLEAFNQISGNHLIAPRAYYSDPDVSDTHTAEISWGDGTSPTPDLDTSQQSIGSSHHYSSAGSYQITVSVTDDDEGTGNTSAIVVITLPGTTVAIPSVAVWGLVFMSGLLFLVSLWKLRRQFRN